MSTIYIFALSKQLKHNIMEKITIKNLTCSELYDLECALHHIMSCYVNRSHSCNGLVDGVDYRHLESVLLSSDEFGVLSKFHEQLYSHLYGSE